MMARRIFFAMLLWNCALQGARGDVIQLKNGGEIRGTLDRVTSAPKSPQVTIHSVAGATITVAREEIDAIQLRSPPVEEYVSRSRLIPHTVEAHQTLADWCVSRQLKAQRAEQLELLLELEPENELAHRSLGHVKQDGQWMTRDEQMTRQGYVLHEGKYITRVERDLLEKTSADREAEQKWFPKVKQWVGWLGDRDSRRVQEGLQLLRSIRDPDATAALANYMSEHQNPDYRLLFVQVAANLPGPKPARPLSRNLLHDPHSGVFQAALSAIRKEQQLEIVKYCLPGLRDASNDVVRRAAIVLGRFGDQRVVPELIDALVTTHRYKTQVPDTRGDVTFGTAANGSTTMLPSGGAMTPGNVEMLSRLGQLPFGYTVNDTQPRRMRTVTVKTNVRNSEVLDALKGLTQQDFGYDQRDWQRWWTIHQSEG